MHNLINWWSHHQVYTVRFLFSPCIRKVGPFYLQEISNSTAFFFPRAWGFRGDGCCFLITVPPFVSADNISASWVWMAYVLYEGEKSSRSNPVGLISSFIFLLLTPFSDWGQLFEASGSVSHLHMLTWGSDCGSVRQKKKKNQAPIILGDGLPCWSQRLNQCSETRCYCFVVLFLFHRSNARAS